MSYKIESPLPIIEGGTGVQSNTPYAVLCGGITGTDFIQSIASVGTAGQVLTSNGAAALPTFQTGGGGGGSVTFPTDNGTATESGGTLNIIANTATLNAGSSVSFSAPGSSNIVQLNVTDARQNTIIGQGSGNLTLTGLTNTLLGFNCATALTSGSDNTLIGQYVGSALTGTGSPYAAAYNVMIGNNTGAALVTGSNNTFLGQLAGASYNGAESYNICIGASTVGVIGESNVLRIGSGNGGAAALTQSFIDGIYGITPATSDGIPVFIGSAGQLGTGGTGLVTTITGDTGPAQSLAVTLTGGSTGASFGGAGGTITMRFAGITANGGTVSLATDATTSTINVGTGAGVKTSTFGSANSTSTTTIQSGSGGTTLRSGTGTTSIANDNTTSAINIGTGSGSKTIIIGNTAHATPVTINSGSTGITLNANSAPINMITGGGGGGIFSVNTSGGTVNISADANANTVNIGTGAAAKSVNVGSTDTTSSTNINSGSGGVSINTGNGGITLTGGTNGINGTGSSIVIGGDSVAATIALGTGSAPKAVTVGSTDTTSSLILNSGSGGIVATGVFGVTAAGGVPVVINVGGTLGTVVSSRRFKHNIKNMADCSDIIYQLNPVTFAYNDDIEEVKQYGLIAEEVDAVFPNIVVKNKDGQAETVQYHILPVLLLNEIKKLNARITALEKGAL
jgi:fibronectin-binding autotransporter adhesin